MILGQGAKYTLQHTQTRSLAVRWHTLLNRWLQPGLSICAQERWLFSSGVKSSCLFLQLNV